MAKPTITIGHLPILDHLILGIAQKHDGAFFQNFELETKQFPNWPSITEAFADKEIDGAFLFAPLSLELSRGGQDIKIVLLGHREGQVLVVRNEIKTVRDLKGKTVFIPHQFSTHHILLHKILESGGLDIKRDIKLKIGYEDIGEVVEALDKNLVQGFIIAEPIGTEAVRRKIGKILMLSQRVKTHHIDCVLALRAKFVEKFPEACQELVASLVKAGIFVNAYPRQAAEIGEKVFGRWTRKTLLEALTHDKGHILFWDLLPRKEDFEGLQEIAVKEMNLWEREINLEPVIYTNFAQQAYREWTIDLRREVKDRGRIRTLPGNFSEAAVQFKSFFPSDIPLAGIKFIRQGDKYPKVMTRIKSTGSLDQETVKEILKGKEIVIEAVTKREKGVTFFQPSRGIEPDRVMIEVSKEHLERCLRALRFGKKMFEETIKGLDQWEDLFSSEDSIILYKIEEIYIISFDYTAFRFLSLLLEYY